MSNFLQSYNFMMDNEDSTRSYATVPDNPPGAFSISGINSASWPTQFESINAIHPNSARASAIQNFYQAEFWNEWLQDIDYVELTMRVFDASVNMGPRIATKLLQNSANMQRSKQRPIIMDGILGSNTITLVNALNGNKILNIFRGLRVLYYKNVVLSNPADEQYLAGWIARAQK